MRQAGIYSGVKFGGANGSHSLPLARIKKIMKRTTAAPASNKNDVKMISGEAPVVFAKACELFIVELTQKSWSMTLQAKRRVVHKDDIVSAVVSTDVFDFLVGLISNDDDDHDHDHADEVCYST